VSARSARQEHLDQLGRLLFDSRPVAPRDWRLERGPPRPAAVMVLAPLLGLGAWIGLVLLIL